MHQYTDEQLEQSGIYAITNTATGRIYIGKTVQSFCARWKHHISYLNSGKHYNKSLVADWREYGREVFVFSIVEVLPSDDATVTEAERRHIEQATGLLYNVGVPARSKRTRKIKTKQRLPKNIRRRSVSPVFLTPELAATILNRTRKEVIALVKSGEIRGKCFSRATWRLYRDSFEVYIGRQLTEAEA